MTLDATIAQELDRMVTTQIIIAVSLAIVALAVLAVAVATFFAVRKVTGMIEPIAHNAEEVSASVKGRVTNVLDTVDELNARLRSGAQAVEQRVKQFGTVVDVVQSEAENLLLDAASTAHGVHAASEALRSGKRDAIANRSSAADYDEEEDVFSD